jgi:transcriptional regulator with XRE-family HTH domain
MTSSELIRWRKKNSCSQGILSIVLGIDVITISRWERGIQKIPPFLHYALEHIESQGHIVSDAIEKRNEERRAAAERRTEERRVMEEAAATEKRAAKRRRSARRAQKRRGAD